MSKPKRPLSVLHPETAKLVAPHSPVQADEFYSDDRRTITLVCQRCGGDRVVKASTVFVTKPVTTLCLSCVQTLRAAKQPMRGLDQTKPHIAKLFAASSPVQPHEVNTQSRKVALFVCQQCGAEHAARVDQILTRRDPSLCASCKPYGKDDTPHRKGENAPSLADAYPHLVPLFAAENELPPDEMGARPRYAILIKCPDCDGVRRVRIRNAARATWSGRCSACAARRRKVAEGPVAQTHPEVAKRFSAVSPLRPEVVTAGSSLQAVFACIRCGANFKAKVANQTRPGAQGRCGDCLSANQEVAA